MVFNKIDDALPAERVKKLLIISIILLSIVYPMMGLFFLMANNPGLVMESQLSFSGSYMKTYYSNIGDIGLYRIAETLDFGFMVSYCLMIICLALIIARKFDDDSIFHKIGYILVPGAIIAGLLDATENSFILLMLTDPINFPDVWAIAHSSFALIKWIILFVAIIYALISIVLIVLHKN